MGRPGETGGSGSPWRSSSSHVPRDTGALLLTQCPWGLPSQNLPFLCWCRLPDLAGCLLSLSWNSPRYFQPGPLPASLGPRSLCLSGQDPSTLSVLTASPGPLRVTAHSPASPTPPGARAGPPGGSWDLANMDHSRPSWIHLLEVPEGFLHGVGPPFPPHMQTPEVAGSPGQTPRGSLLL